MFHEEDNETAGGHHTLHSLQVRRGQRDHPDSIAPNPLFRAHNGASPGLLRGPAARPAQPGDFEIEWPGDALALFDGLGGGNTRRHWL